MNIVLLQEFPEELVAFQNFDRKIAETIFSREMIAFALTPCEHQDKGLDELKPFRELE